MTKIFEWYQKEAQRTCTSLGDIRLDLSHMILGIVSEQEEFLQALVKGDETNQKEELVDMVFYLSNYCTFRGYSLQEIAENYINGVDLEDWEYKVSIHDIFLSRLSDVVKKYIAYGKEINREIEQKSIGGILYAISLNNILNWEEDLKKNIDKLYIRFPNGFNKKDALDRNLIAERNALEI